jgi:hypothetical protein
MDNIQTLTYAPLTPDRWVDFEQLFGKRGACGGCWCMWWRLKRSEFEKQKGEGNRKAMKELVDRGVVPGLLFYPANQPKAWISLGPRDHFSVLSRSRILKPIDYEPVWSIVCFFVAKDSRRQGMMLRMIISAVEYVRKEGGRIVEAYPIEPRSDTLADVFAYTGLASAFLRAGFRECARRAETRPIMRLILF